MDDTRRLSSKELWLILIFWMSLATLSAVNRALDPRGFGFRGISPAGAITFLYVEAAVWAALTPIILLLASRFSSSADARPSALDARPWSTWLVRVPLLFLIGIAIAIVADLALDLARLSILPVPRRRLGRGGITPLTAIGRLRFLNQFVVYLAVLAAGFAREYFIRAQQRQREAVALQAQLAEARLDALRMQINPHFLFNTLNAVSALVERDPSGVRKMIARLSELLRYTLESRGNEEIALRDELGFLERYLDIMKVRFQGKLDMSIDVEPETLDARVPAFILQPIVENALEHGAGRSAGNGRVRISARREGGRLILVVADNGPGPSEHGEGVGLSNTRARLQQMYGGAATFELKRDEGGGARAEIGVPFRNG